MTPDGFRRELQAALGLLNAGRGAEARQRLAPLVAAAPGQPDARALMGLALEQLGDIDGGAAELRRAIDINPRQPQYRLQLGHMLAARDPVAAEAAFRAAIALAPQALEPQQALARLLAGQQRRDEAVAVHRRLAAAQPANLGVKHALAASLNDAGEAAEAEAVAREVLAAGPGAPETWVVLGRALEAQGRYDEAEAAYGQALAVQPDHADAHADLSELVWMRTGDAGRAVQALERTAAPGRPLLDIQRARVLDYAGDSAGALAVLEESLARNDDQPLLLGAAANVAGALAPDRALDFARRASRLAPADRRIDAVLCQAALSAGEVALALGVAERLVAQDGDDQFALALQAVAWRLAGDERYAALYDYGLVRTYRLEPPPGWSSREGFLGDLAAALDAEHDLAAHPVGQSLRGGSQTRRDLKRAEAAPIRGFFQALETALAEHRAWLGAGDDPVRRRNGGGHRLAGAWSVKLRPGGFHEHHVHPRGWLSSAFYVDLPPDVSAGGQGGWIRFGRPGFPTRPALEAEHAVRPEPGLLVLFPSYMWHGVVPFEAGARRLTIAFDVVPAP